MKDYSTPLSRAFQSVLDFGASVAVDYLSNPGNIAIVVATVISCSAGQAVPVAGQVSCAAGLKAVGAGLARTAVKDGTKKVIDVMAESGTMSQSEAERWKAGVDVASIAVSGFNPESGLEGEVILGKSWTVGKTAYKVLSISNDQEALVMAGEINGTGEIVQVSMVKPKETNIKIESSQNSFTDPRDGKTYKTVKIGDQVWMAENLKATLFNDGSPIQNITIGSEWANSSSGAYCWLENDSEKNKDIYGALYNWYALESDKLCPTEWHVPTIDEWKELSTYLGGQNIAGAKLMESGTAHWDNPNNYSTNESGFSARPGAFRSEQGYLYEPGDIGVWWSSTSLSNKDAMEIVLSHDTKSIGGLLNGKMNKKSGCSVRCLKNRIVKTGISEEKTSDLTHIIKYIGKYWFDVDENETYINERIRQLLGSQYSYFEMLNLVQTPIRYEEINGYKFLIVDGHMLHDSVRIGVILFDLTNNQIHVGILEGHEDEYKYFHEGNPTIVQISRLWKEALLIK
ncbi:MAG: hypothetical protein NTU76_01915 [Candidatus Taylorbacteria bacterium]|nr:hypothetical protein [Candidatus Taylorbacteria bacterium]